ncbi:hypothetical protein [Haloarcula marina]|uniref:hypothetical protein n=1 Tax=Haloarcula marina TaxID=2961574 RepID=UPI0020B84267|nr:hypothetical protein [Halomicroarcula marina]
MSPEPADTRTDELTSEAYHITVDGGRDSFCALSIEHVDSETAWLISDTVYSLANMR